MRLAMAEVSANSRPRCKIHARNARWNVAGRQKEPAVHIDIRSHAAAGVEIPFQAERVDADAVDCAPGLKDDVRGDGIHHTLEASAKKTGANGVGQNPTVAHAHIPYARVPNSIRERMPTAGPDLKLSAALPGRRFGDGLPPRGRSGQGKHAHHGGYSSSHSSPWHSESDATLARKVTRKVPLILLSAERSFRIRRETRRIGHEWVASAKKSLRFCHGRKSSPRRRNRS